jgi:TfoX/Sxy family transcriptional regulator of competence genes
MVNPKDPEIKKLRTHLYSLLQEASEGLPLVTEKRMFGCEAFFANQTVYALVWKTGRIGLKLPDEQLFDELMKMEGSAPWTAGQRTMSQWVLVPEWFHEDMDILRKWVEQAHALAFESRSKEG